MGARLLSFVTQSSLSLQGSPVENADKNSCSAFIGATWRRGPTFYWGFQEPLRENFEGAFQCNLCCNTLSVRTIMNLLNLCDSFGFSFMISKVLEFIHSLILNYLTYFENVSLYSEAMKSACIYSYCFDKLANFFSLSNFTQTSISYGCQV